MVINLNDNMYQYKSLLMMLKGQLNVNSMVGHHQIMILTSNVMTAGTWKEILESWFAFIIYNQVVVRLLQL